jgi:hypothetical protein
MSKQSTEQNKKITTGTAVRLNNLKDELPTTKVNISLKPLRSFRGQRSMRPSAIMPSVSGLKSKK